MLTNRDQHAPAPAAHWREPPTSFELPTDEVHVWRAPLDVPDERLERLRGALAPDECERAARFHFDRDRRHYVAARGTLRQLLGLYLGLPRGSLRFTYTTYGKPSLAAECGGGRLRFNVSHSGGVALYAFGRGRELGVDIERSRADVRYDEIAERFFSKREVAALCSLPEHLREEAFFLCWTRKEAYIKCIGEGLSVPLDSFNVSLSPGATASLLAVRGDALEAARWRLRDLRPGPGYQGALVAEGRDWRLKCWQMPALLNEGLNLDWTQR